MQIRRLTQEVVQRILEQNEGFKYRVDSENNNIRTLSFYSIAEGKMIRRVIRTEKDSDEILERNEECDLAHTRYVLRRNFKNLKYDDLWLKTALT